MNEPTETPLPALWQKFLDQVALKAGGGAPAATEDGPYRAMQLYLDIEERAVRLAELVEPAVSLPLAHRDAHVEIVLHVATTVARHLRARLGLPVDPTP